MRDNDIDKLTDRQIEEALARELDRVGPGRDLWPSIREDVSRRQQKHRWRWLDFLGVLSFPGVVVVLGSPAPAVRMGSVALGLAVVAMLAWLALPQLWESDALSLARAAKTYWYDTGELVAVNGASSYDAFFQGNMVNPVIDTRDNNVCRFGLDVDTVSYEAARRLLMADRLPDPDSVRVEEFLNYFDQEYEPPTEDAFAIHIEGGPAPFGREGRWLIRVGLQGRAPSESVTGIAEVIARNAGAHVEFNPEVVSRYRQLGYDYRRVPLADFVTDTMGASEVRAGYSVTALFEVEFHQGAEGLVATAVMSYEDADTGDIVRLVGPLDRSEFSTTLAEASPRFQLNAAVERYTEILRGSYWAESASLDEVRVLAQRVSKLLPDDPDVAEFADLVTRAERIAAGDPK